MVRTTTNKLHNIIVDHWPIHVLQHSRDTRQLCQLASSNC